jgi:hypothetical protein
MGKNEKRDGEKQEIVKEKGRKHMMIGKSKFKR